MNEFFETTTLQLIADYIPQCIGIGSLCIIGGFTLYTIFTLISYGIIQTLRLFNIKQY